MSRAGYSEDCDEQWQYALYRGRLLSSMRGKRGQAFFRDLISALEAMPEKRLIPEALIKDGEVCALGALGKQRGYANLKEIDPEDAETIAGTFGIASARRTSCWTQATSRNVNASATLQRPCTAGNLRIK